MRRFPSFYCITNTLDSTPRYSLVPRIMACDIASFQLVYLLLLRPRAFLYVAWFFFRRFCTLTFRGRNRFVQLLRLCMLLYSRLSLNRLWVFALSHFTLNHCFLLRLVTLCKQAREMQPKNVEGPLEGLRGKST